MTRTGSRSGPFSSNRARGNGAQRHSPIRRQTIWYRPTRKVLEHFQLPCKLWLKAISKSIKKNALFLNTLHDEDDMCHQSATTRWCHRCFGRRCQGEAGFACQQKIRTWIRTHDWRVPPRRRPIRNKLLVSLQFWSRLKGQWEIKVLGISLGQHQTS